ncbi:MAG TPA: glycosyltransferase [Candidatus Acidoferrum sp.]
MTRDIYLQEFRHNDRMKSAARVTVLIDTYNYGRFIEQAIESVLGQDFPQDAMEIVVVDDGSTDDTAERVKKYGERVQYFYKENGGQASAFNFGFAKARGEIVALLDADDYWLPGKLRRVSEEFERDGKIGFVYHALRERDENLGVERDLPFTAISGILADKTRELLSYRVCPTSSLAFRTSTLQKMLPMPEEIQLQADMYLAILVPFLSAVCGVRETLGVYRMHGQNLFAPRPESEASERMKRNIKMRRKITELARQRLAIDGIDLRQKSARLYFEQLEVFVATDEFALEAPSRVEFFRHLLRCNEVYGACGNWKLRLINRVNAVAALALGYGAFGRLEAFKSRVPQRGAGGKDWRHV